MRKLDFAEIAEITAGGCGFAGSVATGGMCLATLMFLTSGVFAPLAAATGAGCLAGIAGGCAS